MEDDAHLSQIQTMWSVVALAHADVTAMQSAQQTMLDRYGGAVRRYALACLRDEDAADEIFQEFALKFVRGDFRGADPGKGRFRAFVKTVVYRLIVDFQRRKKKLGREGQMHSNVAEPGQLDSNDDGTTDAVFHASWRDELLARCWGKLADYECKTGKPYHTALRHRVQHPDERSAELAEGLSKKPGKPMNAGAVRVLLHRSRDAFADLLLDEVTNSLADSSLDAAEQELIELDLLEYCKSALERRREKK